MASQVHAPWHHRILLDSLKSFGGPRGSADGFRWSESRHATRTRHFLMGKSWILEPLHIWDNVNLCLQEQFLSRGPLGVILSPTTGIFWHVHEMCCHTPPDGNSSVANSFLLLMFDLGDLVSQIIAMGHMMH